MKSAMLLKAVGALLMTLALVARVAGAPAVNGPQAISRSDPELMLKQATDQLLEISKEAQLYASQEPERYYAAVTGVLDQVMDTQYFARGVMATYASMRLYKSLQTDAERAAFRDRVGRFAIALKRVWMVKYADALLRFHGEKIELARLATGNDSDDRALVEQTIHDEGNQTYLVQYSLRKASDGGWLIINVIVEDINLGETYRSQFAEAVENHKGDVDYVVDHWVELMIHDNAAVPDHKAGA
jgi:phospholipid transport system substrate-binding protein